MAIKLNTSAAELIDIIKKSNNSQEIIEVVKHFNADESVLRAAVDRINNIFFAYNVEKDNCYNAVIESRKVTPDILKMIIGINGVSLSVIKNVVNSPKVDESILNEAVNKIYDRYTIADDEKNNCYNAIIESKKVTSDILKMILSKVGISLSVIKNAVNSPKVDESVLSAAVDRMHDRYTIADDEKNNCYNAIIESKKVTPDILITIVDWRGISSSVIVNAVESSNANIDVYNKAVKIAAEYFVSGSPEQNAILNAAIPRRINVNNNSSSLPAQAQSGNTQPVSQNSENTLQQGSENNVSAQEVKAEPEVITYKTETEDTVTDRIRRNVNDGMSTMLWGLSGIGKTSRVREIDPTFTMIKLKNGMLPEEVTGGKEPNGNPGEMYPPKWYVKLCEKCEKEPDRMHILFIDEITHVKDNVKSLVWDIIEDRRVNGDEDWELPENCAIVVAGNRPEESTSVITDYNGGVLPEPLHDRIDFHIEIPLDMKEWQQWALETNPKTGTLNIHPSVLSFCVANSDSIMFSSLDVNDVTQPRLSPRRWAKLSKAIYMAEKRGGKFCHVSNQRITECIGTVIAKSFIAHYEKQPLDMKRVEKGQYEPTDFNNIDDKLFALGSLIAEYEGSEMAVIDFIETCLGDDYVAVYNVMKKQHQESLSSVAKTELETTETKKTSK